MDVHQQDLPVGRAEGLDLVADRAQLLLVAVGCLAVGDVEDDGRETCGMGRFGAPRRRQVADAAQCLAHGRLPRGMRLDPDRDVQFTQGDAAVGGPAFDDLPADGRLDGGKLCD